MEQKCGAQEDLQYVDLDLNSKQELCGFERCCSIDQQILHQLTVTTTPMKALELSKLFGISKSNINKTIYSLMNRGKVKCIPSTPPLWFYNRDETDAKNTESELLDLFATKKSPLSSCSIVWHLRKSQAVVNRVLYDLEKEGKVERVQISPPIWDLTLSLQGFQNNSDVCREKTCRKRRHVSDSGNLEAKKHGKQKTGDMPIHGRESSCRATTDEYLKILSREHEAVDHGLSEKIACAVWNKFNSIKGSFDARNEVILAGYVLRKEKGGIDYTLEVIALGTGTKWVSGDKYSLHGTVVHDCHAEIVARRSLLRWLYNQLSSCSESRYSYAIRSHGVTPFQLRQFELWLYCSQSPCGDAAVFSRADPQTQCIPCFDGLNCGKFRFKREGENAGSYIATGKEPAQCFDGLQFGDRSTCLSCSDKLAKRCVVGVQGALMAQLIPPLYMTGIIISNVFSYGHVARALCCRSSLALQNYGNESSSVKFMLHHPKIGHYLLSTSRHKQVKKTRNKLSMNWALGDREIEIVDGTTGRLENDECSRISKSSLFSQFNSLIDSSSKSTYKEYKQNAVEYQNVKRLWLEAMSKEFHTGWSKKMPDVEIFSYEK